MQPGCVPGAIFEFLAAKAALGLTPGINSPLTTQVFDTSDNGNHGTLVNFTGTPWQGTGSSGTQHIRGVAIHFDDSLAVHYTLAYPALQTRDIKATFNIITGHVDTAQYITLANLQEMYASGHDIGNHTRDHTNLTTLSQTDAQTQLRIAKDWLVENSMPRAAFYAVYPQSGFNATVRAATIAESMIWGRGGNANYLPQPISDPYYIPSYTVDATKSLATVITLIDAAAASGNLIQLLFHDLVTSAPSGGQWLLSDFETLLDHIITINMQTYTVTQAKTAMDTVITLPNPHKLVFPGAPAYMTLPDLSIAESKNFTYEVWVITPVPPLAGILSLINESNTSGGSSSRTSRFYFHTNGTLYSVGNDSTSAIIWQTSVGGICNGTLRHISVSVHDGLAQLYVDGLPAGTPATVGAAALATNMTTIGILRYSTSAVYHATFPFISTRIYPFGLSNAQIEQNYAAGPIWASVLINRGVATVSNPDVTLTLNPGTFIPTEMAIRNDEDAYGAWESFVTSKEWTLDEGPIGTRKVWAKFRNELTGV